MVIHGCGLVGKIVRNKAVGKYFSLWCLGSLVMMFKFITSCNDYKTADGFEIQPPMVGWLL